MLESKISMTYSIFLHMRNTVLSELHIRMMRIRPTIIISYCCGEWKCLCRCLYICIDMSMSGYVYLYLWWPLAMIFFNSKSTWILVNAIQSTAYIITVGSTQIQCVAQINANNGSFFRLSLRTIDYDGLWMALFHFCSCSIWWLIMAHLRQTKEEMNTPTNTSAFEPSFGEQSLPQ